MLRDGRFCLCGMLASDAETLPDDTRAEVRAFFTDAETWLARVLSEGQAAGEFAFPGDADTEAALLFAAVEGAMLTAWPFRTLVAGRVVEQFEVVTRRVLDRLKVA